MNVIQEMFNIVVAGKYLESYATDFFVHDMNELSDAKNGDVIAWGVRKRGTHFHYLNDTGDSAYIRDSLNALKQNFLDTEWYIIEIDSDANYPFSDYPNGNVQKSSLGEVLERFEAEQKKEFSLIEGSER